MEEQVADDARSGRPSDAVNEETVVIVRYLLENDRRLKIADIHHEIATEYPYVKVSWSSIRNILKNELNM